MNTLTQASFAAAVFLVAGTVKGIVGMGLPTVAMGLLGLFLPVPAAAALITAPSLVTNVQQMLGRHTVRMLVRLAPMLLATIVGALATVFLSSASAALGHRLLGCVLVLYSSFTLAGLRIPQPRPNLQWPISALVGLFTGALTAATGVFVVPAVPYLNSLDLTKDELSQAMGLSFTTSTLCMAANLTTSNEVPTRMLLAGCALLVPALIGMRIGQWLRARLSERIFKRVLLVALFLLGAALIA